MNVERLAVHNLPLTYAGFVPLAGGSRSFWATQKLAFQQQDEFIIWETTCTKDALKTQSHLFNSLSLFYVISDCEEFIISLVIIAILMTISSLILSSNPRIFIHLSFRRKRIDWISLNRTLSNYGGQSEQRKSNKRSQWRLDIKPNRFPEARENASMEN